MFNSQDFNLDQTASIVGDGNMIDQDMNIDVNVNGYSMATTQSPIVEPMQEREVHRTFVHQVTFDRRSHLTFSFCKHLQIIKCLIVSHCL